MIVGFAQIVHFIIGATIGSFLNVVSVRAVNNKQFYKGRSECIECNKTIRWQDNIPMLSFVLLKGRCRYCKAKISYLYPIVELLTWGQDLQKRGNGYRRCKTCSGFRIYAQP